MKRSKQRAANARFGNQTEYLLTETSPFAVQEAYKTIRTSIIFSIPDETCKKVLITSALQGEAKSTTAVNLGIAFAQNRSKILLIDCDLRMPTDALSEQMICFWVCPFSMEQLRIDMEPSSLSVMA